jgi:hypothetical protein
MDKTQEKKTEAKGLLSEIRRHLLGIVKAIEKLIDILK